MKFKAIKFKSNKTEWHRKFALLPVKMADEYHWLCNVYRKQMNFKDFVHNHKTYWVYIPYTSFDLLKQLDLERQGKFEARDFTHTDRPFLEKIFGPIVTFFIIVAIMSISTGAYLGFKDKQDSKKVQLEKIEKANSVPELKELLREIITSK